ncbi:MotA/TolQ/ExbB proton channel family protein [Aquimarina mytili]|uniref:MotA/TolQ/ExbB proton channel family protein n=1 Tax=Aquimarina mytili TaxID=874423 RepID=A0A937A035_9FLAO|nr:MotA/TolQ/ExbB proton channel family protein [Aquimarina mytili]MBL0682580.1 MotA/TolQ/ExbB proton channel family protein [Aquimarina mytili]
MQLFLMQLQNIFLFPDLFDLLYFGGLFFMVPILIMLLLILFLTIKNVLEIRRKGFSSIKYSSLINSIGLFTMVWGVLGQLVGLVEAFDTIEKLGEISASMLAGGLKISALPTIFGILVFVISRIITIVFSWIQHEELIKE